jgi:FkbH-like protein
MTSPMDPSAIAGTARLPATTKVPATMKLIDALEIVARNPKPGDTEMLAVTLACGFTPLHLHTFLRAELGLRFPTHHVEVATGLYDDIPGTLRRAYNAPVDAIVLVLEWSDLDARLGLRRLGGWSPAQTAAIVDDVSTRLTQLRLLIERVAQTSPVVISLPTLPLPPLFCAAGWQAAPPELRLREQLGAFAAAVAHAPGVRIISQAAIDAASPSSARLSVKSTWTSGFPYQTAHAARLATLIADAVQNPAPKKGLITDLDDTLWRGIVGDDGPENISWDLEHQTQGHGIYQQLLGALAAEGVLVAVASKNDPRVVEEAFLRRDLMLAKGQIFPFAISWTSKAQAVAQVLDAWNIGADSVVFVDDNPAELAEVQAAHPAIECIQFPTRDADAVYQLLERLRGLFGKSIVTTEDRIRLDSLRARAAMREDGGDADGFSEALLEQADAEVTLAFEKNRADPRPLALVNKTNQFNLNGKRMTERAWAEFLAQPDTFLLTVSYADRFGPLGTIAVAGGRVDDATVHVDLWVMSCRAFARRVEHQCLRALFERFSNRALAFDYLATPRNGPLTTFLSEASGVPPFPGMTLSRTSFDAACPRLFHRLALADGVTK